ncbi:MAG: DNA-directed RNA polymerase subunit L [Candidatus Micrarchaeota archaeon]|nr:DNA-directed RNA polymerase subunit L [Candidatus Micrarchaeota archaeon]
MELEVIKNEKEYLEVALKGEEYSFGNALAETLLEDKSVEFAACRMDHPQVASPILMVRVKEGSALHALRSAIKKLKRQANEFKEALKEAKKPKAK